MVDAILYVGLDACRAAKARVAVLWPVPLKDVVVAIQPKAGMLWKYPAYVIPLGLTFGPGVADLALARGILSHCRGNSFSPISTSYFA